MSDEDRDSRDAKADGRDALADQRDEAADARDVKAAALASGTQAQVVVGSIKRSLNFLIAATVVLYVGALLVVFLYVVPQLNKTTEALCTFRGDLQTRVIQTQEYIRDHPEGFPGVSAATLQQSLAGQIRTVTSLSGLNCDTPVSLPPPETPTSPTTTPKN